MPDSMLVFRPTKYASASCVTLSPGLNVGLVELCRRRRTAAAADRFRDVFTSCFILHRLYIHLYSPETAA